MVAGTMSNVGKSLITMVMCRYFTKKGLDVVPFKAQNMSRKYVSIENGKGKIALAQYIQSVACEKEPTMDFNPVLLVPNDMKTQVYFMGELIGDLSSEGYMYDRKEKLYLDVKNILHGLSQRHDLVIIEGAGAFVEPNLKGSEIVNRSIASGVNAKVILVSDISKGGAFVQVAGTVELLDESERKLIRGFIFNKFHGNKSLLRDSPQELAKRYSILYFGTVPYFDNRLPDEDLMARKTSEIAFDDKSAMMEEIDRITEIVTQNIDMAKIEKVIFDEV